MIEKLALMLIVSIGFERIPSYELFGFTIKVSSLIIIFSIPIVIYYFMKKKLHLMIWEKAMLLFSFIGLISLFKANDFERAISVWLFLLFIYIAYFFISRVIANGLTIKIIFKIYLITLLITALFGFWQFIADSFGISLQYTFLREMYSKEVFGFPRIHAFQLEPQFYAFYLLPVIIWLIGNNVIAGRKLTAYWTQLVLLIAFGLTLSRGAFIALVFGIIILIVIYRWRLGFKLMLWPTIVSSIIAVVIVLALIYFSAGEQGTQRYVQHTVLRGEFVEESTYGRLAHYREAWRLFTTSPIIGIGLGNYGVVNSLEHAGSREGFQMVNNQYLETLAETGILGLGALLAIVGLLARELWIRSVHDHRSATFLVILGAMLIQWNFFSNIYILQFWVMLAITSGYLQHKIRQIQ